MTKFRMSRVDDEDLVQTGRGLTLGTGASRIRLVDRRVLSLGRDEGPVIAGLAAIGTVVSGLFVAQGVLVAAALGRVFDGAQFAEVAPWFVAVLVALGVRSVLVWTYQTRSAAAAGRIAGRLRARLYRQLTDLGPGWAGQQRSGALQTTLVDGVEQIESYFRLFVAQLIASLLTVLGVVAALAVIDPLIAIVAGVLIVVAAAGPAISWRFLGTSLRHWWTVTPALSAEFVDSMQGASTLKIFGASTSRREVLRRRSADVLDANMSLNWVEHAWLQPFSLAGAAAGVSAIWIGIVRLDAGAISTTSLLVVLLLIGEALRPVAETKRALHFAMQGMGAAEGVLEILDTDPVARSGDATVPSDRLAGSSTDPVIELADVTLRYRPGDDPALDGCALSIHAGARVALVGPSGAGKTTVASVLLRFFVPQNGTVQVAGTDVDTLELDSLRRTVALVPQDAYLFSGTIADNLRLARPDATESEMIEALHQAAGSEILDRLPAGLDSQVGERGNHLSGGERQRIAIARAFLTDAPILVLDEATSSVDVESERTIQAALDRLSTGRSVLVIAHRLSTVRHADRIVVLDRGRVVDSGTHQELAGRPGRYQQLLAADEADQS